MVLVSCNKGVRTPGPCTQSKLWCLLCCLLCLLGAWLLGGRGCGAPQREYLFALWVLTAALFAGVAQPLHCFVLCCSLLSGRWEGLQGGLAGRVGTGPSRRRLSSGQDVIKCDFLKALGRKEHVRAKKNQNQKQKTPKTDSLIIWVELRVRWSPRTGWGAGRRRQAHCPVACLHCPRMCRPSEFHCSWWRGAQSAGAGDPSTRAFDGS